MHSYKRIYIISSKYCIFKTREIGGTKKERQSLTSLAFYVV